MTTKQTLALYTRREVDPFSNLFFGSIISVLGLPKTEFHFVVGFEKRITQNPPRTSESQESDARNYDSEYMVEHSIHGLYFYGPNFFTIRVTVGPNFSFIFACYLQDKNTFW